MIKNKFMLKKHCFLISGFKRGAIYDLQSGDIFSIDENTKQILEMCENSHRLDNVLKSVTDINEEDLIKCLTKLNNLNLGKFLENDQTIKKITFDITPWKLNFIWLELTDNCNLKCLHCYANCTQNDAKKSQQNLSLTDWQQIAKEAYQLGCRKIQLIGGEPLLFGQKIFRLISFIKELNYESIEIFTNATLLTKKDIEFFSKHKIKVAISIYSDKAEIHDKITQTKGSFEKTINNVYELIKHGVKIRFASIIMRQNQDHTKGMTNLLQKLGEKRISNSFDVIRYCGRGSSLDLFPNKFIPWIYRTGPAFVQISKAEFLKKKTGHNCWQDRLCVKSDGNIMPCVMAREEICGNVKLKSLSEIIDSENFTKLQSFSKDKVLICKDCEYRYTCTDCRPVAKALSHGDLYAKEKTCLYNPYNGKWSTFSSFENLYL